jgi:hypothetical protein
MIGRLMNFEKRIAILKEVRISLQEVRHLHEPVLEFCHHDVMKLDDLLLGIEQDLDRASSYFDVLASMRRQHLYGKNVLKKSIRHWKNLNLANAGMFEEIMELRDRASFYHDQTNSLLKTMYLLDTKTDALVTRMDQRVATLEELRKAFFDADATAQLTESLQPGQPVVTPYGYGHVVMYREDDDFLLVTLPFCEPPARLWIRAREIFDSQRGREQGERKLMEAEDALSRRARTAEQTRVKRELFLMSLEEDVRTTWEARDFNHQEDVKVLAAMDQAIHAAYGVITHRKHAKRLNVAVDANFQKFTADCKLRIEAYVGPESGRPKFPKAWELFKRRREIVVELKERFMQTEAVQASKRIKSDAIAERERWLASYIFQNLIRTKIDEMMREVATEAIAEGEAAKRTAERVSGIMFPDPQWMQYDLYATLALNWKQRKAFLRRQIALKFGPSGGPPKDESVGLDEIRETRLREVRRAARAEKRRQQTLIGEMENEEALARAFYKWELQQNLRERREMRSEDADGKMMREAQKRIEQATMSSYVGVNGKGGKSGKGGGAGGGKPGRNGKSGRGGGNAGDGNGSDTDGSMGADTGGFYGNGGGYGSDSMDEEEYEQMLAAMSYERRRDALKVRAHVPRRRTRTSFLNCVITVSCAPPCRCHRNWR